MKAKTTASNLTETEVIVLMLVEDTPLLGREINHMTDIDSAFTKLFWYGYVDALNDSAHLVNVLFGISDKGRAYLQEAL